MGEEKGLCKAAEPAVTAVSAVGRVVGGIATVALLGAVLAFAVACASFGWAAGAALAGAVL